MYFSTLTLLVLGVLGCIEAFAFHGYPRVVSTADIKARPPKRCVAPPLFQGQTTEIQEPGNLIILQNISYDEVRQRVRVFQTIASSPPLVHDALILYKQGIIYDRNVLTGKCVKGKYPGKFPKLYVPKNATYTARVYVGKSFFIDGWSYKVSRPVPVTYADSWAGDGSCWPVAQSLFLSTGTIFLSYYNITLGIRDPSVWNIPKGCHQAAWRNSDYFKTTFMGKSWLGA